MLHLIQSNKMEVLLASLLQKLAEQTFDEQGASEDLASLLTPDTILVQSPGMSQWLKINIANTLDIAANIEFPLPSSFIWQLYQRSIPDLPKESAFNKQFLAWKILQLLPQYLDLPEFIPLARYVADEKADEPPADLGEQLKCWQLCAKIADVYDQYLMYRPEWILAWEQGEDSLPDVDVSQQPWQPILWRAICEFTEQQGESQWHRANMHTALMAQLEQAQQGSNKPLYVFGISAMPVQQLEILRSLSEHSEVYIFWFNPSEHYWADVVDNKRFQKQQLSLFDEPDVQSQEKKQQAAALLDVGNPLLASWGKPGRDFLEMLTELEPLQADLFSAPQQQHLLGWVQSEVFQLTLRGKRQPLTVQERLSNSGDFPKKSLTHDDSSIEIHATHSRLRELEVLRDQICHWFESGAVESLNDVIVMMPDVGVYAPLIETVFSRPLDSKGELQERGIPFAISDRSQAEEDSIVTSFLRLMAQEHSRMTLTEVFELFKVPEIAARYGIGGDEIQALHRWCYEAGVRWGWSGLEKQHWQLPQENQNTWIFGLQRLLAGYAHQGAEVLNGEIVPYGEVEGQLTQALGLLLAFVEDLRALTRFCRASHPLQEKVSEALLVLDSFYLVDSDNEYRLQKLKETIAKLKVHSQHYAGKISQQVFVQVLNEALNESGVGQRFLAGRLNFCTLMPMRSIPFKHVCILGLNEPDYPRQTTPISFDLVSRSTPRKGDRSRRLDDRYLFLEALLSARDKLYLSYQGRDDKSNETKEPSILVSELVDYCQQSVCFAEHLELDIETAEKAVKQHLLHEHPLQPWDASYFATAKDKNRAVTSFDRTMFEVASTLQSGQGAVDFLKVNQHAAMLDESTRQDISELELHQLQQFFRNPVRGWFKSVWKTQFPLIAEIMPDDEPLNLDSLQRYQATSQLLQGDSEQAVMRQMELEGQLPIGNLKLLEQDELSARAATIKDKMSDAFGGSLPTLSTRWLTTELIVSGTNTDKQALSLTGAVQLTASGDLVSFRPGKLGANDYLAIWMSWNLVCAVENRQSRAWFFAADKTLNFEPIEQQEARENLQLLVELYLKGQQQCLAFFPKTALIWAQSQDEGKTLAGFAGNSFLPGEASDLHIGRVYPQLQGCWQSFTELADTLLQPILAKAELS
ncbi:exodeoxyribonuclease V subunit gamma [Planctobacterium marinum]|uniref:RecBCD enzyme subunit RecC n=1 Tax=Planctobacterium marinum TaxID=1631968 RepID=A0AA48KS71_9ALTE|nr:RecBCD enzyme subunit RecC [Planctobacterium marinum]